MLNGNCPHCKKTCQSVRIKEIPIDSGGINNLRGISYICKNCNAIISIQIDPVSIMHDTVAAIKK